MADDPNNPNMTSGPILPPMFPPMDAAATPPPIAPGPQVVVSPVMDVSLDIPWHEFITHTLWRYVGTLFMDVDANGDKVVSIGRSALTALMALAIKHWWTGADIPSTMMQILMALLAYNLGNKGFAALRGFVDAKKGDAT